MTDQQWGHGDLSKPFPPVVYRKDDDEREVSIKDDVLSPHIWWHRD